LSQALTVWGTPWICLLQGVGYVGWDAILTSFVSALTLIGQIVASLFGGGLVSLAIVAVAGALLQRIILFVFARRKHPELFNLKGNWRNDIFREILPLAGRAWLTAMGTILVQNTDGFFIAAAQGADNIPAFRAGFLVVLNVHMLAGVFASASSVFISQLWQSGDVVEAKRIVMRNLRIGIGLVLCGGAAVLAAGPLLFNLWLGPGNYAGGTIMWLFVVMFALEQQSFVLSTSCRATNDEAFAGWMMAGGILKLILAAILVRQLGLTGLVLGTIIAQAATTHWFVVVHSLDRLRISAIEFFLRVLAPCVAIFGITVLLCLGLVTILKNASDLVKVIAAFGVAAGALAIGSWLAVLDQAQRIRFLVTIGWLRSNDQMEGK
jgi:O-antigen/teichoic acid export membrane protein